MKKKEREQLPEVFCLLRRGMHSYRARQFGGEVEVLSGFLKLQNVFTVHATSHEMNTNASGDSLRLESFENGGTLICDAVNNIGSFLRHFREQGGGLLWHFSVHRRNEMPVWVELRITKFGSYPLLEPFRDKVFESLRFFVYLFDRVVQYFVQESLYQPMMADDLKSPPLSLMGENDTAVSLIFDKRRTEPRPVSAAYS